MSTEIQKPPGGTIREFIAGEKFREQVAMALPSHMTPDRFARVALTALTKTPKLLDCSRESLLKCLMDCSSMGLEPDGRMAHLIPYGTTATLIIDYKGLIALAKRSGEVRSWSAELVCEEDQFSWKDGVVSHSIEWRKDRGAVQCVYSRVLLKDGSMEFAVMTLAEVEAIRKRSRSGSSGPWVSDFSEMAKKTIIRRHSKNLTLSPEFRDAMERDGDVLDERNVTPAPRREAAAKVRAVALDGWKDGISERPSALPPEAPEWVEEEEGGAK